MKIRFRMWNDGQWNCATARQRGWHIIDELTRRGHDAAQWQYNEECDVVIVQRADSKQLLTDARATSDRVWLDVNDDVFGPDRRQMGGNPEILGEYEGVLAASRWLETKLQRWADNVHYWPEAVDPIYAAEQCKYSDRTDGVRIAWMGGSDNLNWFELSPIWWVLPDLAKRFDLTWVVAMPPFTHRREDNQEIAERLLPGNVQFHPWKYETVGGLMASCDCAIIALEQTEWCWAKSDNKPAAMMAMGLPVVMEDIRCYAEAAKYGVAAYQAEDWEREINRIVTEPMLRQNLGQAGRKWAGRERSIQRVTDMLLEALGA